MNTSLRRLSILPLLTVALGACSDSSTSPTTGGDPLTAAEIDDLAEVLAEIVSIGFATGLDELLNLGPAAAPAAVEVQVSVDVAPPCPLGGTVHLVGELSFDVVEGVVESFTEAFTLTHNGCRAQAESGLAFTLDGDPNITFSLEIVFVDTANFTIDATQSGGIAWSTEGRSGTCGVDLTMSFTGNVQTQQLSGSASGSMCGQSFSGTINL